MIHNKFRYLLTLVALFAMTTGAWADYTVTWRGNTLKGIAVNKAYAIPISAPSETTVKGITLTANVGFFFYRSTGANPSVNLTSGAPDGLVFSAETNIKSIEFTFGESACFNGTVAATPGTGGYTLTTPAKSFGIPRNDWVYDITKVVFTLEGEDPNPNEVDLDFNNAMTEAEFEMPANDVTVDYELVRDMAIDMPVTVGDGTDGYRIRLKKEGTSFVPAEMTPQQMAGLIVVKDDIEEKTLTNVTDYTVQIFAVDDQDEPTGNAIAFQSLTPGRYVAIASAADGSIYDGKTQQSNVFVLFQGYEIVVPAGEYVTYYRDDDNLYVEGEGAKLYTITDVDGSTATATEITSANKEMPFLIYNGNTRVTTFLLIPTDTETNQAFYAGFKGTTEATTIAASDATSNNYALNGRQFVWVKNDLAVGANKAWLEIPAAANNARALTLVFDDATKITTTNYTNLTDGDWYDLNGRKLQSVPTKKGVYIMNGRKVVIK